MTPVNESLKEEMGCKAMVGRDPTTKKTSYVEGKSPAVQLVASAIPTQPTKKNKIENRNGTKRPISSQAKRVYKLLLWHDNRAEGCYVQRLIFPFFPVDRNRNRVTTEMVG